MRTAGHQREVWGGREPLHVALGETAPREAGRRGRARGPGLVTHVGLHTLCPRHFGAALVLPSGPGARGSLGMVPRSHVHTRGAGSRQSHSQGVGSECEAPKHSWSAWWVTVTLQPLPGVPVVQSRLWRGGAASWAWNHGPKGARGSQEAGTWERTPGPGPLWPEPRAPPPCAAARSQDG